MMYDTLGSVLMLGSLPVFCTYYYQEYESKAKCHSLYCNYSFNYTAVRLKPVSVFVIRMLACRFVQATPKLPSVLAQTLAQL